MSITSSYDYSAISGVAAAGAGIFGGIIILVIISTLISLAISVLMVISEWIIISKNGKPGWYSLIPFLNIWTLFEIVDIRGWWQFVPFANIVFLYICLYRLAIKHGKSSGFGVFTIFFPYIGLPIIAFKKDTQQADKKEKPVEKEDKKEKEEQPKETEKNAKKGTKFCAECGTELKKDDAFCPGCGAKTK